MFALHRFRKEKMQKPPTRRFLHLPTGARCRLRCMAYYAVKSGKQRRFACYLFAGILHIPAMRVVFNIRFTGEAYIGT
jgi:hypothetical protein